MKKRILLFLSVISTSVFSQTVNMSNGTTNTCSATFYDSGGPGSNYGNNESFVHTFFPATVGSYIEISFTSYVSGPADQISIYDGPDNTYPLLFNGGGNLTIPTFVSSDITGAITVEFNSNNAGNQAGWVATVTCCLSPQFWYADVDGDGFGSMWDMVYSCTQPVGYIANGDDCDDNAITYEDMDGDGFGTSVQTGCGSYDNSDCDDNLFTYADNDADNFGDPNTLVPCGVTDNTDCDDNNAGVGSGTFSSYFPDNDGDGFGDSWGEILACSPPTGYVDNSDDCDDFSLQYEDNDQDGFGNPLVLVGCGSYDNTDCDDSQITYADNDGDNFGDPNVMDPCGVTDNSDCDDNNASVGSGAVTEYFEDQDGDGFGADGTSLWSCSPVPGYVANNDDCDDWNILYEDNDGDGFGNPSVETACGVYDNSDCDDNLLTYLDSDGDNFGDPNMPDPCGVSDNTDCDDSDAGIGGGVISAYYPDNDGDGFGFVWGVIYSCSPVPGYVTDSTDCDDWSTTYEDNDGDGFGNPASIVPCGTWDNTDCNDNQLTFEDFDGDGYGNPNMPAACGVTDNTDCDDNDNGVGGGAMTAYYLDADNDNYGDPFTVFYSCSPVPGMITTGGDCNDWDNQVNPGVAEIPGNGMDDNCDGYTDPVASIEESTEFEFVLFPNPAKEEVNILLNTNENNLLLEIFSMNGQLVLSTYQTNSGLLKLKTDELIPGLYLIKITTESNSGIARLVIE